MGSLVRWHGDYTVYLLPAGGGYDLSVVPAELTYGLERIAMYLQRVENVFDLKWSEDITYGEMRKIEEYQHCVYAFEESDVNKLRSWFDSYEDEAMRLIDKGLTLPAYDYVLKCSHTFNLLDARGDSLRRSAVLMCLESGN